MMLGRAEMWPLLKATFAAWNADNGERMGAALAYYSVLSLAPMLLVAISLAGLVFGHGRAQLLILSGVGRALSPQGVEAIRQLLAQISAPESGRLARALGGGALLVGALGVVAELQVSLNQIWKVPARGGSLAAFLRIRFASLAIVLAIGVLLLASLVLGALFAALGQRLGAALPIPVEILQVLNASGSFAAITLTFALTYKLLPHARVAWGDVWAGALAASLFFTLGNFLLGVYIGKTSVASMYGKAGALVAIMVWAYYCAQILYLGAEFTHACALAGGRPPPP